MEENERMRSGPMSRGVSTGWDGSADVSGGRPEHSSPGFGFYHADTALPSPALIPRTIGRDTRSGGSRRERLNPVYLGQPSHRQHRSTFEQTPQRFSTSTSDAYMTDDVHVHYDAYASSPHHRTMIEAQSSQEGPRRGPSRHLQPREAEHQIIRPSDLEDRPYEDDQDMGYGVNDMPFPSSYPSNTPFLPPPPPTSVPSFDPSAVMFPGPGAIDGGIRIVSPHDHGDAMHGGTYDGFTTSPGTFDDGWKRHSRVYGGGACLACAGKGGFYGATARPEDRR